MKIINGKILTMAGRTYENGYVAIKDDKIAAIGDMSELKKEDYGDIFDAEGGYVLPGFIDAHTHIGVICESIGVAVEFVNEISAPITASLRVIDGLYPFDFAFEKAVKAGVTSAVVGPGSANVIGGQMAAIKLRGERVDDMIIKFPCAMKMALGDNPRNTYGKRTAPVSPVTRMGVAAVLRNALMEARDYMERKERGEHPPFNANWEALIPVLKGELPVNIHAHRSDDIFTAMRIAKEFHLKLAVVHCTDGCITAKYMHDEGVPAIVGPTLMSSTKLETINLSFKTPAAVAKAKVKMAITTDHDVIPLEYLPVCAAVAVRNGLDPEEALKAITINAAEIAGIADRVGSLEVGKDADISVFTGHPFDYTSTTKAVFIDGKLG